MTAIFTRDDWEGLTPNDKRVIKIFARVSIDYEPLAKAVGVGQQSMDALIAKGLAEEGSPSLHGRRFKLTEKGWYACEWIQGRRPRS